MLNSEKKGKLTAEDIRSRIKTLESNFCCLEFQEDSTPNPPIDPDTWLEVGLRAYSIENEFTFCEQSLLQEIFRLRSSLDSRDKSQVREAHSQANIFEVRSRQFMTRAALKIANLDAMFGWKICQLPDGDKESQLLYFVDVFGGPGSCSEYVLWRNDGWNAKGFGFTPRGDYEFHVEMFQMAAPESFDPFYGANDDGHIFDPENINAFLDYVKAQTEDNLGAHLIMCDGGLCVKNNNQEIISKQLYLCLVLLAVGVIRPGGNALLKVFDLYTPFSVGLVYILTKCYQKVSITKPASSRPANSERYIVCQNRMHGDNMFLSYLLSISQVLWENRQGEHDINHIISLKTMQDDTKFYNFICKSNNDLARRQIGGLQSLIGILNGTHQQMRVDRKLVQDTLWRLWKLDLKTRMSPTDGFAMNASEYAFQLIDSNTLEMFTTYDTQLCGLGSIEKMFVNPRNWSFMSVDVTTDQGKNIRTMFLSKSNGSVFYYDREKVAWRKLQKLQLILSPKTLLYGEIAQEITETDNKQKITHALHIIDAFILGGKDIRYMPQNKRNAFCEKFAKALNRPLVYRNSCTIRPIPIRCKQLIPMIEFEEFFNNVSVHKLTTDTNVLGVDLDSCDSNETKKFYIPRGLLFVQKALIGLKGIEKDLEFGKSFSRRILWIWNKTTQIYSSTQMVEVTKEPDMVYRQDLEHFIEKYEDQ